MKRFLALTIALSLGAVAIPALAQGIDHSRYQRTTLNAQSAVLAAKAAELYAKLPHKFGDTLYESGVPHWVVSGVYTGAIRAMTPDENKFIETFFRARGVEQAARDFSQAMLFTADGRNYWLPVEAPIVPYFAKELKKGQAIDLYLIQPGGTRRSSGWEWLFLVEDFQAKAQPPPSR